MFVVCGAAVWLRGLHCFLIARKSWVRFPPEAGPFYEEVAWSPTCSRGFPHHQNLYIGVSGVVPQAWCWGCALLLSYELNAETRFHMWSIKYLFLILIFFFTAFILAFGLWAVRAVYWQEYGRMIDIKIQRLWYDISWCVAILKQGDTLHFLSLILGKLS